MMGGKILTKHPQRGKQGVHGDNSGGAA